MAESFIPNTISTFVNDTTAVNLINGNFSAIATLFNDVLSRSGVSPNQMNSVLDMNGNQIINLSPPASTNSPARLIDVVSNPTITVPPTGTSGAVVGFLNGNNTYSGTSTFTNQINLNFPSGAITPGLNTTQSLSGSSGANVQANHITISSDNVAVTPATNIAVAALAIDHTYGGAALIGARASLRVFSTFASASAGTGNNNAFYGSAIFLTIVGAADSSLSNPAFGDFYGINVVTATGSSLGNIGAASGQENDVLVRTGTTPALKWGYTAISVNGDAVQGSSYDSAFAALTQTGGIGWKNGFLVANQAGLGGINATGTCFGTQGSFTVNLGVDVSSVTCTTGAFRSTGFLVNTVGQTILTNVSGSGNPTTLRTRTSFPSHI